MRSPSHSMGQCGNYRGCVTLMGRFMTSPSHSYKAMWQLQKCFFCGWFLIVLMDGVAAWDTRLRAWGVPRWVRARGWFQPGVLVPCVLQYLVAFRAPLRREG